MFYSSYPKGFPTGSANFGRTGRGGQFGGFSRGQIMKLYRGPHMKNILFTAGSQIMRFGDSEESILVRQICHKQEHTTDACWHRYGDANLPPPNNFGRSKMMRSKTAYVANFEPFSGYQSSFVAPYEVLYSTCHYNLVSSYLSDAFSVPEAYVVKLESAGDEGWYLDSGATHRLTHNMVNMQIRCFHPFRLL